MLGKLMKHEWRSTSKMGCLMLGAVAVVTLLGWLSFQAPAWQNLSGRGRGASWMNVFSVFTLMMYAMLLACCTFGFWIYLGVRFYRTMYTDQGYLTHTLPVSKHQILISKILISGLWTLLLRIGVYLSLFFIIFSMIWTIAPESYLPSDVFGAVWELLTEMESLFGFRAAHVLGMWIAFALLGGFTSNIFLFGGITLGQLMPRGRLLLGILFYILILVGDSMIVSLFRAFANTFGGYLRINLDLQFIVNLLVSALLYVVMYFVITRKLNLT